SGTTNEFFSNFSSSLIRSGYRFPGRTVTAKTSWTTVSKQGCATTARTTGRWRRRQTPRRRRSVSRVSLTNHPGYNAGMNAETISPPTPAELNPSLFDLGHQGDVDRTQIAQHLRLTPTERLRHHESWRLFVKEAVRRAEF